MPLYRITTSDGKDITVDHGEATVLGVFNQAREAQVLLADEVDRSSGRQERRVAIAIPYHAITVLRTKD